MDGKRYTMQTLNQKKAGVAILTSDKVHFKEELCKSTIIIGDFNILNN